MRTLLKFAVLPAVLGAAALAASLAPRAGAAAPADIQGAYSGKAARQFLPILEGGVPSRDSVAVDATVELRGSEVVLHVTLHLEESVEIFDAFGYYGQGRFWATGPGPSGQMTITGKATGSPGKARLSCTGTILSNQGITKVNMVVKQQPAVQ